MVTDGVGHGTVAWLGADINARRHEGDEWLAATAFGSPAHGLSMGANRTGDVLSVSVFQTGRTISTRSFTPSTGWASSELLASFTTDSSVASVDIDSDGRGVATWIDIDDGFTSVWGARFEPRLGWGAPVVVESLRGDAKQSVTTVSESGEVTIAWILEEGSGRNVYATTFHIEDSDWGVPTRVSELTNAVVGPMVAQDDQVIVVGWLADESEQRFLRTARWADGTWESQVTLSRAAHATLAADGAGGVLAVLALQSRELWWSCWEPGAEWATLQMLDVGGEADSPDLAIDIDSGNAVLVFRRQSGVASSIWTMRYE